MSTKHKILIGLLVLFTVIATFAEVYYKLAKTQLVLIKYSIDTLLRNSVVSHKKASEELSYYPRPIKESIKNSIIWFKEQRML